MAELVDKEAAVVTLRRGLSENINIGKALIIG